MPSWNVVQVDRNLVAPLQEMQLAEDLSAMEVGCYVIYVGQRVVVGFGDYIKVTVIAAVRAGAVVFLD